MKSIQPFSANEILLLLDQCTGLHAIDCAMLMLQYALPEADYEWLMRLPLGRRDRLLIEVRQVNFGDALEAHTECPECKERLEFFLSCDELLRFTGPEESAAKTVTIDGRPFELRSPDSRDATATAAANDIESAIACLLARCAKPAGDSISPIDEITRSQRAVISAALTALDPAAEILLYLSCPACGIHWQALFDINHILWVEIRARARGLLQEVDALARVYHWNESEILGMSPARRRLYLEMTLS
jgi:hypothetical protein